MKRSRFGLIRRKSSRMGSSSGCTTGHGKRSPARPRRLLIEALEDRALLDAAPLDPHGLFPGERSVVGTGPQSVVTGDFNGDGKLDLATANTGSATVSVLLGRGDGTFSDQGTYAVGRGPWSVITRDFNRDGKLDLAVANKYANPPAGPGTISVLFGHGDGTFANQAVYSVGNDPSSVTAGDFNGDGWLDLAVANETSSTISVLLYRRDGTFAQQAVCAVGSWPCSLTAGDFNGDGNLDLAAANFYSKSISLLLGHGNGTFADQTSYTVDGLPQAVTVGDFNGDGRLGFAAAVKLSNSARGDGVSVFVNRGNGSFALQTYAVAYTPVSITSGDFNWDGKLDLATADKDSCTVSVLMGRGDGTFADRVTYAAQMLPIAVTAGDFNGDGALDLATANDESNTVTLLLGRGDGTFALPPTAPISGLGFEKVGPSSVTSGDFDNDGSLDLAATSGWYRTEEFVSVLLNCGNGTFSNCMRLPRVYAVGDGARSLTAVDLNADGHLDLVTANQGETHQWGQTGETISVLLSRGDGTFSPQAIYAVGRAPSSVATGDFSGDGKLDLVVANQGNWDSWWSTVSILLGRGDGTFAPQTTFNVGTGPSSVTTGDFNGDGKLDLATTNRGDHTVSVLLGRGDGTFGDQAIYAANYYPLSATTADFNGDGRLDIATANLTSNAVAVLLGRGDGTFGAARITYANGPQSLALGDFNRDGKPDLAVVTYGDTMSLLLGRGDGTFEGGAVYAVGHEPASVTAGDYDADGRLDVVVANARSHTVSLLLQNHRDVAHWPFGAVNAPVDRIRISFPAPMDPTSLALADDLASFAGPNGPIAVTGYAWADASTLELDFPPQTTAGVYTMILGPGILDTAGRPMDIDRDGIPGEAADDRYRAQFTLLPTAVAATINDGTSQRSTITSLAVQFNGDVAASLGSGDLTLVNTTLGTPVDLTGIVPTYDKATNTARWNLAGLSLEDGRYTARLLAAGITDAAGNPLAGGDYLVDFFRLLGDSDGSGSVDIFDVAKFQVNYGQRTGMTAAEGDFDLDGDVDILDVSMLQTQYGKTLAALASAPAAAPSAEVLEQAPRESNGPVPWLPLDAASHRQNRVSKAGIRTSDAQLRLLAGANSRTKQAATSSAPRRLHRGAHGSGDADCPLSRSLAVHHTTDDGSWQSAVDEVLASEAGEGGPRDPS